MNIDSSVFIAVEEMKNDQVEKMGEYYLKIDFSLLMHNSRGFHILKSRYQSKLLAHFLMSCKKIDKYLENTVRTNTFKEDRVTEDMIKSNSSLNYLKGEKIEHFCIKGYKATSDNQRDECKAFRIHGLEREGVFYLVRIDPNHLGIEDEEYEYELCECGESYYLI